MLTEITSNLTYAEQRRAFPVAEGADPAEARRQWSAKLWLEAEPGCRGCFVQRVDDAGFWYFGPIFAPQHVSWERLRN